MRTMRYDAFVGECAPRTRHFLGAPPKLTGRTEERKSMPYARVLLLDVQPAGDVQFDRYAESGTPAGDTWHAGLGEAREQAEFEYGEAIGAWNEAPADVEDAVDFALARLSR